MMLQGVGQRLSNLKYFFGYFLISLATPFLMVANKKGVNGGFGIPRVSGGCYSATNRMDIG